MNEKFQYSAINLAPLDQLMEKKKDERERKRERAGGGEKGKRMERNKWRERKQEEEKKRKRKQDGGGEKSRLFVLVVPRGTRGSTSKAPFSAGLNPGVLINPAHLPVNALANNRRMNSSQ